MPSWCVYSNLTWWSCSYFLCSWLSCPHVTCESRRSAAVLVHCVLLAFTLVVFCLFWPVSCSACCDLCRVVFCLLRLSRRRDCGSRRRPAGTASCGSERAVTHTRAPAAATARSPDAPEPTPTATRTDTARHRRPPYDPTTTKHQCTVTGADLWPAVTCDDLRWLSGGRQNWPWSVTWQLVRLTDMAARITSWTERPGPKCSGQTGALPRRYRHFVRHPRLLRRRPV